MAVHKSNLAQRPPSLSYRIVTSTVHDTARIEWTGTTEHDANTLASGPASPAEKSKLDEAKEFLRDELSDGPMWAKAVLRDARDAGVATTTLYSAKTALRVRSEKVGVEGWQWALPTKEDDDLPTDANHHNHRDVHNLQNGHALHSTNSLHIREGGEGIEDVEGGEGVSPGVQHHHLPADDPKNLAPLVRAVFEEERKGPAKNLPHYLAGATTLEILTNSVLVALKGRRVELDGAERRYWERVVAAVAEEERKRRDAALGTEPQRVGGAA
jgi:hypothetical protein